MSVVSWFPRFRGFNGFIVSCVSWFHRFRGVNGFMVSYVSRFHRFRDVNGFMVSCVSWFYLDGSFLSVFSSVVARASKPYALSTCLLCGYLG